MTAQDITELDAETVERIAAGEVVERPASAVKELLENSIDAAATRVTVSVEAGGRESIRVSDDGLGMSESAVRQAVQKHTTSKISDIDDLESGVGTLGFRGEALHAIGAVSRLTIRTRPRGGDQGTELTVEGGEISSVSPVGCPEGTIVDIEDLFYNVPARRKYLKQDSTEFAHVNTVVTNYALANPEVAVTLEHNDRETFATTGTGNLRETIMSVYGRDVAESMIELDDAALPDGPLDGISGVVSHPETNRSSRTYLSTFVNGRYVTANTVRESIVEAYGGQLAGDRYPFAVVFLDVDPGTVDVNVHPRKLEVRFADEAALREQIESVVESALLREGLIRSSAPRGKSAAKQTEIKPADIRDGKTGGNRADGARPGDGSEEALHERTTSGSQADESSMAVDNEREGETQTNAKTEQGGDADTPGSHSEDGTESSPRHSRTSSSDHGSGEEGQSETSASTDTHAVEGSTDTHAVEGSTDTSAVEGSTDNSAVDEPTDTPSADASRDTPAVDASRETPTDAAAEPLSTADESHRKFSGASDQQRLDGCEPDEDDGPTSFQSLPSLRILGQLQETYIVAETANGLVLIDQHAADERINYERLRNSFDEGTTTQALAQPVQLKLTAREAELFRDHSDALASLGFHASLVDDRTVEVTTVPSLLADTAEPALVRSVLEDFVSGDVDGGSTIEAAADELLADMACYPSITGNTSLTDGSILDLLVRLDECENPYACPHGRPVIVEFDTDELEARFERDYPGHGH